jgi:hypothetical protein
MILVVEAGMCSVVLAIGWLVENGSFILGRGGMAIGGSGGKNVIFSNGPRVNSEYPNPFR